MRKELILILAVTWSLTIMAQSYTPVNAIYSVANHIKSDRDIVAEELRDFDFIYLVGAPEWVAEDFDGKPSDIKAKYVDNHTYPNHDVISKYISTVHAHGGKVLCSFPGSEFIDIASSPLRSRNFAQMMAQFVEKYDFDGIELDWEHTIREDLHLSFMQQIRTALDSLGKGKRRYWLTSALHHYRDYTPQQAQALCECADWINIMFYDMGGGIWGTKPSHNAPLDEIMASISTNWAYFPHEKLHIGLPNYGFYYKGILPGQQTPEGTTLKDFGRYCNYTELPPLLEKGWAERWDDKAKCAYFISPDSTEFMTLETTRSMDNKLAWIEESGFGGVFWWEYSCDWIRPAVSGEKGTHLITDYVTSRIKSRNQE